MAVNSGKDKSEISRQRGGDLVPLASGLFETGSV